MSPHGIVIDNPVPFKVTLQVGRIGHEVQLLQSFDFADHLQCRFRNTLRIPPKVECVRALKEVDKRRSSSFPRNKVE
jgi:hypothetical protein